MVDSKISKEANILHGAELDRLGATVSIAPSALLQASFV